MFQQEWYSRTFIWASQLHEKSNENLLFTKNIYTNDARHTSLFTKEVHLTCWPYELAVWPWRLTAHIVRCAIFIPIYRGGCSKLHGVHGMWFLWCWLPICLPIHRGGWSKLHKHGVYGMWFLWCFSLFINVCDFSLIWG